MAESYRDEQRRLLDALVEEPSGTLGLGQDLGLGRRRRRRRLPPDLDFDPGNLLPFGSTPPAGMPRWVQWIIDRVGEPIDSPIVSPTDRQTADRLSQRIPDQVRDRIAASGGDGDLGPYVPEPSKTWSFQPRINEPFAEPPSDEEFQRRLALSHLNAIIHPTKAAVVKRLAGSMLGLGPLGQKAVDLLPQPSFTDPEALYLQSITDAAQKDIDWMDGRHHEAAPPLASEIEAYQSAQAVQAAAEQAAMGRVDPGLLAAEARVAPPVAPAPAVPFGLDFTAVDPGLPAQDFDPEVALAIAGITPESLGM